jgi:hypothetical protein
LNEIFEYFIQVSINVVVVDYINEVEVIVNSLEETEGIAIFSIDDAPLIKPGAEGLVFPDLEGCVVYNSRLDHFFSLEYAPCYCVDFIISHILFCTIFGIYSLIGYHFISVKILDKRVYQLRRQEKFKIGLLVDVAISITPSIFGMVGWYSV